MRRVLVTRPEPGASRTAARLREMGLEPVSLPLSKTAPLAVDPEIMANHADAVVVTSANAIRHASAALLELLKYVPCHAVGRRTAEATRKAGFLSVTEGPGDAGALADQLATTLAGKSVAYLCGRVRFAGFEERLDRAGVHVQPIETYDTMAVDYSSEDVAAALSGEKVEAVLLYSATAAAAAGELTARPALNRLFAAAEVLALSARIALAYRPSGDGVRVAGTPREEDLLALLERRDGAASSHRPFSRL